MTALLDSEFPGAVPPLLAIDEIEGWLLLDDIGSDVVAAHRGADGLAVRRLVALQRAFVGHTADLIVLGCPTRSFATLPAGLATVFADPVAQAWIALTPNRADEVLTWTRGAVEDVAGLGLPDTLRHGDFHPHNVSLVDGEPVIFDWSDAAVGHPLVDAVTWCSWWRDDDERNERAWREFLEAWRMSARPTGSNRCERGSSGWRPATTQSAMPASSPGWNRCGAPRWPRVSRRTSPGSMPSYRAPTSDAPASLVSE